MFVIRCCSRKWEMASQQLWPQFKYWSILILDEQHSWCMVWLINISSLVANKNLKFSLVFSIPFSLLAYMACKHINDRGGMSLLIDLLHLLSSSLWSVKINSKVASLSFLTFYQLPKKSRTQPLLIILLPSMNVHLSGLQCNKNKAIWWLTIFKLWLALLPISTQTKCGAYLSFCSHCRLF